MSVGLLPFRRLTAVTSAHTLQAVIRAVAAALVVGLALASVSARVQHVHAYRGHDHADHDHGTAVHGHVAAHDHEADDARGGWRLEACDPAAHVVPAGVACALATVPYTVAPAEAVARVLAPLLTTWRVSAPRDVRAHSPPRLTDAPLRAPPRIVPA